MESAKSVLQAGKQGRGGEEWLLGWKRLGSARVCQVGAAGKPTKIRVCQTSQQRLGAAGKPEKMGSGRLILQAGGQGNGWKYLGNSGVISYCWAGKIGGEKLLRWKGQVCGLIGWEGSGAGELGAEKVAEETHVLPHL